MDKIATFDINTTTNQLYPYQQYQYYPYYYPYYIEPKVCSFTIHVFPCQHCKKCQCGKLLLP